MSAIEITRQDLSISQLRAEAARTADAKQARRILAIAMVLDEHPRLLAAQAGGMDRQTLRDWVHRYNADGLGGLACGTGSWIRWSSGTLESGQERTPGRAPGPAIGEEH